MTGIYQVYTMYITSIYFYGFAMAYWDAHIREKWMAHYLESCEEVSEKTGVAPNKEQLILLGQDTYWAYLVHRELMRVRLVADEWTMTEVDVPERTGVMIPHYMWHGGGDHFASDGPSLRVHVYGTGRELHHGERVEGTIYDVRADRQLFPLMRYFPAGGDRVSMYGSL
jgi:hypothetical protein